MLSQQSDCSRKPQYVISSFQISYCSPCKCTHSRAETLFEHSRTPMLSAASVEWYIELKAAEAEWRAANVERWAAAVELALSGQTASGIAAVERRAPEYCRFPLYSDHSPYYFDRYCSTAAAQCRNATVFGQYSTAQCTYGPPYEGVLVPIFRGVFRVHEKFGLETGLTL